MYMRQGRGEFEDRTNNISVVLSNNEWFIYDIFITGLYFTMSSSWQSENTLEEEEEDKSISTRQLHRIHTLKN